MRSEFKRAGNGKKLYIAAILACTAINVISAVILNRFEIPLYLDTTGTILITMTAGAFPGIVTAVVTNLACTLFNQNAIYFGLVNTLICLFTAWFIRKRAFNRAKNIILYILASGLISGILGSLIEWRILRNPEKPSVAALVNTISEDRPLQRLLYFMAISVIINIIDKGISLGLSLAIYHFIPQEIKDTIRSGGWRQRPLTGEEIKETNQWIRDIKRTTRARTTLMLIIMIFTASIVMAWVGLKMYFENFKAERIQSAKNAARFTAAVVDGNRIDEYLRNGSEVPGYRETEELMYNIRDNAQGVEYLYVLKIGKDGSTFIFDLDAKGTKEEFGADYDSEGYQVGEFVPIEEEFAPYMDSLLAGEEIEPIESDNKWNWIVTAYYPIYNESGQCVCYAGADASMDYVADYVKDFGIRILLAMAGVLALVLAYGMWATSIFTIYPIESMGRSVDEFTKAGADQVRLDESVKKIRSIDINTGDEVEKLYHAFCDMALNQTELIRSISRFSDNTSKMQDGLIITMADLVENRDSDTGAHVQKTSAYVKIIVEGLKAKGYYAEKITPKFMSDVVRSAPLHDIGKINIPDNVLNKPGKLNDEEYEIMKTHTTAGKKIIEKTIDTVGGENYLKEARNMAAYHHERWDGKGYPEGLHGEVIPLSARIMAVADVFDALTSPRVYKPAFPLEKAIQIIEDGKGTQFDPKCVEALFDSMTEVLIILKKYNRT